MKIRQKYVSAFFELRTVLAVLLGFAGLALAFLAMPSARAQKDAGDAGRPSAAVYRGISPVVQFDISPPLRSMKAFPQKFGMLRPNEDRNIVPPIARFSFEMDPVVQTTFGDGPAFIPPPGVSFDSVSNISGVSPPDPVGAVGPNHFVVMSNLSFQVHTKTGASVAGPFANNTLWAGFGGPCQTQNAGDPIVLYDRQANRWLLTQFTSSGPTYFNCVALSTSGDPAGTYYRYAISTGSNFPDYPKYGIWPDAYYISTREFAGNSFAGVGAYALNRAQMLAGNPTPQVISFVVPPGGTPYNIGDGLLPADLDGSTPPPPGSPNYFIGSMDNNHPYGAPQDALTLWKFTANFATPASSSFVLANTIPVAPYNSMLGLCGGSRACIPQPSTTNRIDHLGYRQRPLHRLAYRNFGTHESLVTNQSVSGGTGPSGEVSGIRWWELRSPNSTPFIHQQGTFAPGVTDGVHRWMGSMAMDGEGNIGLGYSSSNSTLFPSIQYTGRYVDSPLGTMPLGEGTIHTGTGSQTGGGSRWGDYTALTVDPVDDTTFWFVNQYLPTTSASGWRLRVGSFKLSTVPTNILTAGSSVVANAGANGVLDPGETVTVSLGVQNVGGPGNPCTAAGLTGTIAASGGVTNPQSPQNYGAMCAGSGITYRDFTFTVDPALACGSTVTVSMNLTDGVESFGPLTYTFTVGSTSTSNVENFDGVTAPALPSGWTTTFSGSGTAATTSTNFSDTAPNNVFLSEAATVGLSEVTSASIPIPAGGGTRLSFRNLYNTEATYDGLVLEISINGAPFQDIIAAGGTFVSGGYTGTLNTGFSNPLPGRAAWSGLSGGTASAPAYITSVVNLPPAAAGQLIQLKWRQGSDSSVVPATNPGSRIDTIRLSSFVCGGSAPTLVSAVSRKVHGGGAGTFNLPLSLGSIAGNVTTEPRLGAMGNHQLVMTFSAPVTVGSTVVTSGVSGSSTTVAGAEVTVNLTGVENAERVAVTLNNVASGANLGNVMVPVGFLLGDTNNSRAVSGADVSLTKATVGGPVTASTFRSDVNANGFINSADVGLVKSASGTVLP